MGSYLAVSHRALSNTIREECWILNALMSWFEVNKIYLFQDEYFKDESTKSRDFLYLEIFEGGESRSKNISYKLNTIHGYGRRRKN